MTIRLISLALLFFFSYISTANTSATKNKLSKVTLDNGEKHSYDQLLEKYQLTGLSLAVINDYQIVYTHTAGFKEFGQVDKIDINTAFSTASISKAVTGTIAAMLAEKGALDLDKPVSDYLKRWKIPSSPYNQHSPITLRHLLTHTAGTSQSGFADFYLGDDIPTLIESLNGVKLPRYKHPISINFKPNTDWDYSGGGYVIAQVAIEDITGKSLAQLAEEMIFTPLKMPNTTMYQHGHSKFLTNVAKVHDGQQKVIGTGIPICPQIAPSGMWSNSVDMAKFIIDYQKALAGKKSKVISPWVAKETTKVHTIKKIGGWGAGWMRFEATGNLDWFSHGGSNTGTGGHVMGTMEGGKGIIVMINAPTQQRIPAIKAIINSIIKTLNWEQTLTASQQKVPTSIYNNITGRYLSPFETIVTIEQVKDKLIYHDPIQAWDTNLVRELVYMGDNKFALNNFSNQLSIQTNPEDKQQYLTFYRQKTQLKNYAMRKLSTSELLPFEVAKKADLKSTLNAYRQWIKKYPDSKLSSAQSLNNAGYQALQLKDYQTALNLFNVAVQLHPNNANAFDSLAEASMITGNNQLAKKYYKKSLAINPENKNAKEMLIKLK
ncbi:serine hydrolase [Aliikangiella sp. IMCC44359]|uniref:serine hydrolase n=1 Tax=Aliikangiella sp. IMCC44359 TaxID=3459125 RepID=UPI00403A9E48